MCRVLHAGTLFIVIVLSCLSAAVAEEASEVSTTAGETETVAKDSKERGYEEAIEVRAQGPNPQIAPLETLGWWL